MEFQDLMVIVRFQKDHVFKELPSFSLCFYNIEGQVLLPSLLVKIVIV